jgi:hypothetical protein
MDPLCMIGFHGELIEIWAWIGLCRCCGTVVLW